MKVSIKDIARAAGVSHSTVSRALAGSTLINPETRTRIRRLAREMGYSPDATARSLVMGRTLTIGVVVTTIADPWSAQVVEGIEGEAYTRGYSLILAASGDDPFKELAAVEMLHSKRVDAVIVTSSRVGALHQERLGAAGVPVILLNNHSHQGGRTFSVRVDDEHGARLATEHLIGLGHRTIAHLSGPAGHSPSINRLAGYREGITSAGIRFEPRLVLPGNGKMEGGEAAFAAFSALAERPTAVFCYNDLTAIGMLRSARAAGLNVPGDLAVAGFDDIPFASYVCPPLTTVAQPKLELGQRAMAMAMALVGGQTPGEPEVADQILQGKLIVRASTYSEATIKPVDNQEGSK